METHLLDGGFVSRRRVEQEHDAPHEIADGRLMRVEPGREFFFPRGQFLRQFAGVGEPSAHLPEGADDTERGSAEMVTPQGVAP